MRRDFAWLLVAALTSYCTATTTEESPRDKNEVPTAPTYINLGAGSSGWSADCFSKFPHLQQRFTTAQLEFFCQQVRAQSELLFNDTRVELEDIYTELQLQWIDSLRLNITARREAVRECFCKKFLN